MSLADRFESGGRESDTPLVCEFCGCEIEVVGQSCPALDDGGCRP